MLSPEFRSFYLRWHRKADDYDAQHLGGAFDRFFTLFVVYNRLYAQATFELARQPGSGVHIDPNGFFPDGKAAKKYVGQFLKRAFG